ncbi:MAG TPA: hypothetical protein VJ750_09575 [Rhizomicrobium sp.]|nr:hypothetical protein [Rhizomicrobium sp.]
MKTAFGFLFACAAVLAAAPSFAASPMSRVKARLVAFDGSVMTLEPLPAANAPAGEPFIVFVLPQTRYVGSEKTGLDRIKPGDYAGAAVTQARGGTLRAQDVFLYDNALRGTGEGRFPESGRVMVNGTVSAAQADAKQGGTMTLHYRGAVLSGLGRGRTLCEGRASPPAFASALACEGDAVVTVPAATPVSVLTVGDKSLLVPGSLVTVTMTKGSDDKNVTPGLVVEKPGTVEKPQSLP